MKSITIGIPAYNEEKNILRVLNIFTEIPETTVKEIIVLVDASSDKTEEIVKTKMINDRRVKLIPKKMREGKARALEQIIRNAEGELLFFSDADIFFDHNSALKVLKAFESDDDIVVTTGRWRCITTTKGFFKALSEYICELSHRLNLFLSSRLIPCKVHGSFFAIKKGLITNIPKIIVSDDEYISYIGQKIGRIIYVPDASYKQKLPDNLIDYLKWRKRIITGHLYLKLKKSHLTPTVNPKYLGQIMMRYLLSSKNPFKIFLLTMFLILSNLIFVPSAIVDIGRNKLPYLYHIPSTKDITL